MRQRLIRVLVYEGPSEWIADCIARRGVKGSYVCPQGVIKEAIVSDFLETILPLEEKKEICHGS